MNKHRLQITELQIFSFNFPLNRNIHVIDIYHLIIDFSSILHKGKQNFFLFFIKIRFLCVFSSKTAKLTCFQSDKYYFCVCFNWSHVTEKIEEKGRLYICISDAIQDDNDTKEHNTHIFASSISFSHIFANEFVYFSTNAAITFFIFAFENFSLNYRLQCRHHSFSLYTNSYTRKIKGKFNIFGDRRLINNNFILFHYKWKKRKSFYLKKLDK